MAISAGPVFSFNPSVSFIVNFDPLFFDRTPCGHAIARDKLDEAWAKLSQGGEVLLPIGLTMKKFDLRALQRADDGR